MEDELSPDFFKQLKVYISIQEKLDDYNEKIKELKEKKDKLEKSLVPYMIKKELTKKTLQYKDRKIYIKDEKIYTNLSYKYLNEKINNFFKNKNPELVEKIIDYLKAERDIKINKTLVL
jgi:uncharacterized protein (DUF2164 family)